MVSVGWTPTATKIQIVADDVMLVGPQSALKVWTDRLAYVQYMKVVWTRPEYVGKVHTYPRDPL